MPLALTTVAVVAALHVMAVLAAFGLPFGYPLLIPYVRRRHPVAMPGLHEAQHRLLTVLTGPGTGLIVVSGAYMASKGHYWGRAWVAVPLAIVVVIGVVGAWVVGATGRMAEMARRDVDEASGAVRWSADYDRLYGRYLAVETLLGVLVAVAIFFMVARPFA